MPDPPQQQANSVVVELAEQKVLRAVYSERQLQEVLTDFWFNHFNVDARKGPRSLPADRVRARGHPAARARQVSRPARRDGEEPGDALLSRQLDERGSRRPAHAERPPRMARGRFRRTRWGPPAAAAAAAGQERAQGLNENYGRELMELHTLGVDGGYTQKDVTEVARAFTGWTIDNPRAGRRLQVRAAHARRGRESRARPRHQGRRRRVRRRAGARHPRARIPSTARFIATKLARRFVSDTPPPALVDRAAARFRETNGDLREVTRTILTSPEFLSPDVVPREGQDAVRVRRQRAARDRRRRAATRSRSSAQLQQLGDAALHVPAADRLQGHGRRVGEHRRAGQPDELRADARRQQDARRVAASLADVGRVELAGDLSETTRATIAKATMPQMAR